MGKSTAQAHKHSGDDAEYELSCRIREHKPGGFLIGINSSRIEDEYTFREPAFAYCFHQSCVVLSGLLANRF